MTLATDSHPTDRSVAALFSRWETLVHASPEDAWAAHVATSRIHRRARRLERSLTERD